VSTDHISKTMTLVEQHNHKNIMPMMQVCKIVASTTCTESGALYACQVTFQVQNPKSAVQDPA